MSLTDREVKFAYKVKELLKDGKLLSSDDAIGLCLMANTDEKMDKVDEFLDKNPDAGQYEILMFAFSLCEEQ